MQADQIEKLYRAISIVAEKQNEQTHNKQYPFDELAEILFI
jgi:hypothetical protein